MHATAVGSASCRCRRGSRLPSAGGGGVCRHAPGSWPPGVEVRSPSCRSALQSASARSARARRPLLDLGARAGSAASCLSSVDLVALAIESVSRSPACYAAWDRLRRPRREPAARLPAREDLRLALGGGAGRRCVSAGRLGEYRRLLVELLGGTSSRSSCCRWRRPSARHRSRGVRRRRAPARGGSVVHDFRSEARAWRGERPELLRVWAWTAGSNFGSATASLLLHAA